MGDRVMSVKSVGRGRFCPVDGDVCGGYFDVCARCSGGSDLLVALCPRFGVRKLGSGGFRYGGFPV